MTQKEKAKELVQLFYNNQCSHSVTELAYKSAKKCALICIDDELKMLDDLGHKLFTKLGTDSYMERCFVYDLRKELEEVKQEINKL